MYTKNFIIALACIFLLLFLKSVWDNQPSRSSKIAYLWLLGLAIFSSFFIYTVVIPKGGLMGWDEAEHSLRGLILAKDVRSGQWLNVWKDTNAQTLWGPGYAWLLAFVYLIWGDSFIVASSLSLFFFASTPFLVYWLGLKVDDKRGWLTGLIAATLTVSNPFAIQLSALPMIESGLAFMLVLALLVRPAVTGSQNRFRFILSSLITAFIFLTKYNYGLMLVVSMIITDVCQYLYYQNKTNTKNNFKKSMFYGYSPFLVVVFAWFALGPSEKIKDFFFFMQNVPRIQSSLMSEYRLLYYPKLFISEYAVFPGVLALVIPFLLLGLMTSFQGHLYRISIFFVLSFIALTLHPLKDPRYFVPILPFLWLIVATGLISLLEWVSLKTQGFAYRMTVSAVMAFFLLVVPLNVYSNLKPKTPYLYDELLSRNQAAADTIKTVLVHVHEEIIRGRKLAVWGTFAEISPALIKWTLLNDKRTSDKIGNLIFDPPNEAGKDIGEELAAWFQEHSVDSVLTIYMSHDSLFFHHDYQTFNAWKLTYIQLFEESSQQYGWRAYEEESFVDAGIVMRIYRSRV